MRAAVVYEHGAIDQIRLETNYPEPELEAGWVKVAVRACSLNFHDLFSRRGMPGIKLPLPLVIGSDIAGVVAEVADDVTSVQPGTRVLIDPLLPSRGMIGERWNGGRAEYCGGRMMLDRVNVTAPAVLTLKASNADPPPLDSVASKS